MMQSSGGGEGDRIDDLRRDVEAMRDRISRLSEASVRINESLDFEVVLRRAAGSGRSGDADQHVASRCPNAGCHHGANGVAQPGGEEALERPCRAGPPSGGVSRCCEVPACRRTRDLPARMPPRRDAGPWRDCAGRGGRHLGSGRWPCAGADQRHADPLTNRRGRVRRRNAPGHDGRGRAGTAARRVPGHGEPRVAHPAIGHQGLGDHLAGSLLRTRPRRDARVLPHHQ